MYCRFCRHSDHEIQEYAQLKDKEQKQAATVNVNDSVLLVQPVSMSTTNTLHIVKRFSYDLHSHLQVDKHEFQVHSLGVSNVDLHSRSPSIEMPFSSMEVLTIHPMFQPFCKLDHLFQVDGSSHSEIQILRDTCALQSLLHSSSVSPNFYELTGEKQAIKGVGGQSFQVPVVDIQLKSDLLSNTLLVGLIDALPEGVDFLAGNDLYFAAHQAC
jgi:hypothetical protein